MKIEEFINGDIHPTKNFWTFFLPVSLLLGFSPLLFGIQQGTNQAKIWGIFTILIATPITISLWKSIAKHEITGFWKYFLRLQCIISAATVLTLLITLVLAFFNNDSSKEMSVSVNFYTCKRTSVGDSYDKKNYILKKFFVKSDSVYKTDEYIGKGWQDNAATMTELGSCKIINQQNWKCTESESIVQNSGKVFKSYKFHQVINGKYEFIDDAAFDWLCPVRYEQIN